MIATLKYFLPLLGLLAFSGMPAGAPAPDDDLMKLRALEDNFGTAIRNKDVAGVMAVYAPRLKIASRSTTPCA
jgi:hypothetical protein